MPVQSLRFDTLEALKKTPKGKIKFEPCWSAKGVDIFSGCKEVLSLPQQAAAILDHLGPLPQQRSSFLNSVSGNSSPGLSEEISVSCSSPGSAKSNTLVLTPRPKSESEQADSHDPFPPESQPAISLLSPSAMETAGCILIFEAEQRRKAKMKLEARQEMQESLMASVVSSESEQLKRFEELMELKQRQDFQSMRDTMDRETKESIGRQEKLKEEQRHRIKILNLRLREAEQQRLREAEMERHRQAEGRERLRNLNTIQEEILQLNKQLEPSIQSQSALPPATVTTYSVRGNQLCSQVSEVVRKTAEGEFPSMEDMAAAERALQDMRALIRVMQEDAARAQEEKKRRELEEEEERRKQAEQQAQQSEQKVAAPSTKEKAQKEGLQKYAAESTRKWYKELQESATRIAQSCEELSSPQDAQTKRLKLELQKAATIPVSQISSNSGSQLREVFDKMDKLLSGRAVVSGGKSISVSQHPRGLSFVCYKLAEKFVKQGEEEVAAHHEAAFPIAVVACGIWERHPQVGDLFLAHLHKRCPYAIPNYPPMKEGTPLEEYRGILGYRDDEGQDSFLKRMSGMVRLYAAVIQLRWPYGAKDGAAPHGLNHGWRWLAQMLNMEPLADITATLLFDFLEVCGHAMVKLYQSQFWKLMLLLQEEYLPRIEAVTSEGQMGSLMRLKGFLETSLKTQQIRPPKGELSVSFWRS